METTSMKRYKFMITTEGILNEENLGYTNIKIPGTIFLTYSEADYLREKGYEVIKLNEHEIKEEKWVPLPDLIVKYIPGPPGPMGPVGPIGPVGPKGDRGDDGIYVVGASMGTSDLVFELSDGNFITLPGFRDAVKGEDGKYTYAITIDLTSGDFTFTQSDETDIVVSTNLNSIFNSKENKSEKGKVNGYASLDSSGKVPLAQIPDLGSTALVVANISERNSLNPTKTIEAYVVDASADSTVEAGGAYYIYDIDHSNWIKISEAQSMNYVLDWSNVVNKPSTYPPSAHTHSINDVSNLQNTLNSKAPNVLVTTARNGLMSYQDKIKLNSMTNYTHPRSGGGSRANLSGATVINGISVNNEGHVTSTTVRNITANNIGAASTSHSHNTATTSSSGFMSKDDKIKLDGINLSDKVSKSGDTMTGTLSPKLFTVSTSINWNLGNKAKLVLNSNRSVSFSNPPAGTALQVLIYQSTSTAYTITWPSGIKWNAGMAPDISEKGKTYIVSFIFDGSYYLGICTGPF